jgi:hypothetical protein
MPGSQSGVTHNISGGTIKFSPNGTALSPAVMGFTGIALTASAGHEGRGEFKLGIDYSGGPD